MSKNQTNFNYTIYDLHESSTVSSILIEMGGMEIAIRRSEKRTGLRSKSVTPRTETRENKFEAHELLKPSESVWDYSMLHGKITFFEKR